MTPQEFIARWNVTRASVPSNSLATEVTPEWTCEEVLEFPGSVEVPWARYVHDLNANANGAVRYPRIVARDAASAANLAAHTLTGLYNQRPAWLGMAHPNWTKRSSPPGLCPEICLLEADDVPPPAQPWHGLPANTLVSTLRRTDLRSQSADSMRICTGM